MNAEFKKATRIGSRLRRSLFYESHLDRSGEVYSGGGNKNLALAALVTAKNSPKGSYTGGYSDGDSGTITVPAPEQFVAITGPNILDGNYSISGGVLSYTPTGSSSAISYTRQ